MLELESLVFKVDTSQLTQAAAKVKELGTAVSSLNKPISDLANASAKVDKAQAKTAKATEDSTKATEKATKVTKEQQSVLERQKAVLDFMTQGMSKGQATTLAYAQATGAATQELNELVGVLQTQRKLQGGDPFDKSTSGLTALRNRLTEVREANRLYNAGIQLTRDQTRELARDKERIIERIKAEAVQNGNLKVSLSEIKAALIAHKTEYIKTAGQVNSLISAEKELERQHRDSANAVRALAREEEKVDGVVNALTGSVDHHTKTSGRAAESIARYARNLRLAGVSGVEAAAKLKVYEDKIRRIQSIEEKRKVDLLSRSLAPQISDVVVSLGSGMNPMTVLLQQGLQVRDLIGQSGVEVEQLQKAFRSAAADMVSSIKGTATALGSLLVGSIIDSGKAVGQFLMAPFTLAAAAMSDAVRGTDSLSVALERLKLSALAVGKIGIFAVITAIVTLGVALRSVIKEENELNLALSLTNSSMGVSVNTFNAYSSALNEAGVSTRTTAAVLVEMSKAGNLSVSSLKEIATTAQTLKDKAGVPIADTVKKFSELAKEPSKVLVEFAKSSGLVKDSIVATIFELERQGKKSQAAALAMNEYAQASKFAAQQVENNYGYLTKFGVSVAEIWNKAWDAIMGFGRKVPNIDKLKDLQQQLLQFNANDNRPLIQSQRKAIEDQIKSLNRTLLLEQDKLLQQQEQSRLAGIRESWELRHNNNLDASLKLEAEIKKIRAEGLALGKSEAEIQKQIAAAKAKAPKGSNKEQSEDQSKLNSALATYADLVNKSNGFLSDYNEKEAHLNFLLKEKKITQAQYNEVFAELLKKQPVYLEQLQLELDLLEATRKARELDANFNKDLEEFVNGLFKSNVELEEQLALIGKTTEEQLQLNKQKAAQLITEKKLALVWEESIPGNERRVELLKQEIAYLERKGVLTEDIAKANKLAETTKMWTDGITDAIVTGLFEGGKAGSKKLRDLIVAELRKPVVVYVQAIVGDIVGGLTGSKAGGLTSGLSKITDLLSGKTGLGATLSNALGSIGASATYGTMPLSQQSSMLAAQEAGMGTLSDQLASLGQTIGNVFSGYSISKALSNGYKIDGLNVNAISAIASAFFGPIAGVIGGLVNRAFGRKLKDTGIEGTFDNEGFQGSSYQFYKGGWLRSDKTKRKDMDPAMESALGAQFTQIKIATGIMAATLGLNSDYIDDYTKKIKFSTKGLSEAKIQEKLKAIFEGIQEDLAKNLMGTFEGGDLEKWIAGPFVRAGENATESLTRVYNSLIAVNGVLNLFNMDLMEASLAGGDLSSQIVDLFGTLDDFRSQTTAYYDTFFTEQEKATKLIEILTGEFADLDLTLPTTIQGYRDLVEAQDLTTEEGRATFAALIQLSSGFAQATQAFESFGNAVEEEINRLRGEILQDSVNAYAAMQSQFAITTAAARAGDASALESLPELSKQVESAFLSQAGSAEDVARVRAWLADSLSTTLNVLGIPGFATGGMHTGGARIVGENGPELEVTGPSRIYNANQTANMFDNSNLVTELVALREEVVMLRSEVRADVQHNAKTAKILERVSPDGDAIQTRVAT